MRRAALASGLAVLLAGAAVGLGPLLLRERDYPASVPSPNALFEVEQVSLAPGSEACFEDVAIEPHSERARLSAATRGRPGPPLRLRVTADGYAQSVPIPGGYEDGAALEAPLVPPARALPATVCIRNDGRSPAGLHASGDRTRSRSLARVDGRETGRSVWFALFEARRASALERLPLSFERMSVFRPDWVGPWLLWPLAALFVVGVPALALRAVLAALAPEDRAAGPPQP